MTTNEVPTLSAHIRRANGIVYVLNEEGQVIEAWAEESVPFKIKWDDES